MRRIDEWIRSDGENRKPFRLLIVFLFGFIFSVAVVAGLSWLFAAYETARWRPWLHEPRLSQDRLFDIIRNAVTTAAALGVGITLFFSYRRQRTTEATQRITAEAQLTAAAAQDTAAKALELSNKQYELERERRQDAVVADLRSRYSRAADQMGEPALASKLAGVFALATLADDWDRQENSFADRQTCIDLLVATYRASAEGTEPGALETKSAIWRTVIDRFKSKSNHGRRWVGSHLDFSGIRNPDSGLIDLRIDGSLDFSRTTSDKPMLVQATTLVDGGVLSFARSRHERIEFQGCSFSGGILDLSGVAVGHRVAFLGCVFDGTFLVLSNAATSKNIELIRCTFKDFPSPIIWPGARKLKFVQSVFATKVLDEEFSVKATGSYYPFDLVLRDNDFKKSAPKLVEISNPGNEQALEHIRRIVEGEGEL